VRILNIKALQGANYFSPNPVIVAKVDLEQYDEVFTSEIPGFVESLLKHLPTLREHKCSEGVPGGFVSRMQEGTLLTHVMEHIAIELQYIAYMEVGFGKTRSTGERGIYNVIFSYWVEEAGVVASEEAVELIKSILDKRSYDLERTIRKLLGILDDHRLGPSTAAIVDEAERRGITVLRLDDYSLIQLGEGKFQKRLKGTVTSDTGFIGVQTAGNKGLTTRILRDSGIPTPKNAVCSRLWAAKEDAEWIGYPVVVKPIDGHHGKGVTVGVADEFELEEAFSRAKEFAEDVVVEELISGNDYRLLVVEGKMIAAVRRIPAHVIGDGEHTIAELIEIENKNPQRGYGHEREMTRLAVSSITERLLSQAGKTLETRLAETERFDLELTANLSTGGTAKDVTDDVHPANRQLAERAARIIGLDIAGIDILTSDIRGSIVENQGAVIEVNAAPGLRAHLAPSEGKRRNVAAPIVDMLFPDGLDHDIPIISVTGTNGKTTTVRLAAHMMAASGRKVGMTCTDGIYISGRLMVRGDMSGPHSAGVVLRDPTIDCAVFETARGGLLRRGLGYKNADVGIVLNVAADHIGLEDIDDLDDLAYLKSLVAETVRPGGFSVLNADDPRCVHMTKRCYEHLIYFTMDVGNPIVAEHTERGGLAVIYQNDYITLVSDGKIIPVAKATDIPITYGGTALFNIQNAMAAIASVYSLGLSVEVIRQGVLSFFPSFTQLPGRANLFRKDDYWIGIDYAHNARAYEALCAFIKKKGFSRTVLTMSAVGDRRDMDILSVAGAAAPMASEVFLFEDPQYLRGRRPGEITKLLRQGFLENGLTDENIHRLTEETDAIREAMQAARPDDLVLIMSADGELPMDIIRSFNNKQSDNAQSNARPCEEPHRRKIN
jgi:cyanophycin synthetase